MTQSPEFGPKFVDEETSFEKKKRSYFSRLSRQVLSSLKEHQKIGLFRLYPGEKQESWKNVTQHCLVEAARVEVLADKLGLSEETRKDLMRAAAIHDFFKKKEIQEYFRGGEGGFEAFEKAGKEERKIMQESGISPSVMQIVDSLGYEFWEDYTQEDIQARKDFSEIELARMILNYTDAFTRGSNWVTPAETLEEDLNVDDSNLHLARGSRINDLIRRFSKQNPAYQQFNLDGRARFGGKTTFELELGGAQLIGGKLCELIQDRTGEEIDPIDLPEFVDKEIKTRIEQIGTETD